MRILPLLQISPDGRWKECTRVGSKSVGWSLGSDVRTFWPMDSSGQRRRGSPDSPLALPGKEVDRTKTHPSEVVCSHPSASATLEEVDDQKCVNSGNSNQPPP